MTMHSIISGATMVIDSWGLSETDCCLNMMPLNHVGGLIRNLFAPIIAGGSTVCCSQFDPSLFWDVVEQSRPTWYYASPTMHTTILAESSNRQEALSVSNFRLICNAAGGLLPSLAVQLRDTFRCTVLPSYGMTECMPISTPPLNYILDRPGTSGISTGVDLAILDNDYHSMTTGAIGNINVRGGSLFPGYLKTDDAIDTSCFSEEGWFNTGDVGYLDDSGYLYVTGRSKEVINRGGELISPVEIEDAIMKASKDSSTILFNKITDVLAFSTPHDVLQEVAAVVLVMAPGVPRPDLRQLRTCLKGQLHQSKWPEAIVFMDGVPRKNHKVIRTALSKRLSLPTLTDQTRLHQRYFHAVCPPPETAITKAIQQCQCRMSFQDVRSCVKTELQNMVDCHVYTASERDVTTLFLAPRAGNSVVLDQIVCDKLLEAMQASLHGYLLPSDIVCVDFTFPRNESGAVDQKQLLIMADDQHQSGDNDRLSVNEQKLRCIYADILGCSPKDVSGETDFFHLGGDSLKAGKLISIIRKQMNVRVPIDILFTNSSVSALCAFMDTQAERVEASAEKTSAQEDLPLSGRTHSLTNPLLMMAQLAPIMGFFPLRRALEWTTLLYALSTLLHEWPVDTTPLSRVLILVISVVVAKTSTEIVAPLAAILMKWVIIGRYQEGLYPMWGLYHTRWWLVQKALAVGGMGIFKHHRTSIVLYHRLLGAKIGSGVSIDKSAILGEHDLLTIDDNVTLDQCICRAFAAERNTTMYLGRIHISANSHIGLKSIVAAGSFLPRDTCIGPNSSSWEANSATEANRDLSKTKVPQPHLLLQFVVGWPIVFLVRFLSFIPRALGLYGLVTIAPGEDGDWVDSTIVWFAAPERIGWHFLAFLLNITLGVVFYFLAVVALKQGMDRVLGKLRPGPASQRSEIHKLRTWLMTTLIPEGNLGKFTEFFGTHYEVTSWLVRALGGKVGKRIYWPGTGPSIQDFDLIDIGDDVVFGSRAHIITSDGNGSHAVKVGAGSMIADRVILLPGTTIGENVVMGSGALTRRDGVYGDDTVWVGSKGGEAVCLTAGAIKKESISGSSSIPAGSARSSSDFESRRPTIVVHQSGNSSSTTLHGDVEKDAGHFTELTTPAYSAVTSRRTSNTSIIEAVKQKSKDITVSPSVVVKELRSSSAESTKSQEDDVSRTPFGRAFYQGKASYYVLGLPLITIYSTLLKIVISLFWNASTIIVVQILAHMLKHTPHLIQSPTGPTTKPFVIFAWTGLFLSLIMTIQSTIALATVIASKWLLMGRRKVGQYNWDESTYNQNWQVLLSIERLRRSCYGGAGILSLLTSTVYINVYFRLMGAKIGHDTSLYSGGLPSLYLTEPELVNLGNRCNVDDASLVAHVNSRGCFGLNEVGVGDGGVMRAGTRCLSGGSIEGGAMVLEHSLVVGGEVVPGNEVVQGWPGGRFEGDRFGVLRSEKRR